MKRKIIALLMAAIFVTIIFAASFSLVEADPVYATENFTPNTWVSLDFWNPSDIENALRAAFLDVSGNFNASFNVSLANALTVGIINGMNTTLNDLLDPLVTGYIETVKDYEDDLFNRIEIFLFCILITGLAFWRNQGLLDCVAAGTDIYCGLMFSSEQEVSSLGWIVGVMIAVIGFWLILHRIRVEIVRIRRRRAERAESDEQEG